MTAAQSIVYVFGRVDSDGDISTDTVEFSLDKATWAQAEFVDTSTWVNGQYTPGAQLPALVALADSKKPPPSQAMSGYWFRALAGPGNDLAPVDGTSALFVRPQVPPQSPIFETRIVISN